MRPQRGHYCHLRVVQFWWEFGGGFNVVAFHGAVVVGARVGFGLHGE